MDIPAGADHCDRCGFRAHHVGSILSFVADSAAPDWQSFFDNKASAPDGRTTAGIAYTFPLQHRYMVEGLRRFCSGLPDSAAVLDVGCGNGLFWEALFGHRPIVGVDYSREMCRLAQARGMQVYHADAIALPFADDQFDLIYSAEIIQYIEDLPALLTELARVCRPGGRIVVTTLNRASLIRRAVRFVRWLFPRKNGPKHSKLVMRSAAAIVADGARASLDLQAVCWSHFPFPWQYCATRPHHPLSPLASNVIVAFDKRAAEV
jgi:SAM-dependent methyltransferase